MSARSKWMVGLVAALLSCAALAGDDPAYEKWLTRVGDYQTLHRDLFFEALAGDPEKQERLADFLLGPHGRKVKAPPYEGVQFLYRAAIGGRTSAMRHLADALNRGAIGLGRVPAAAGCWSSAPAGVEQRLACVRLTEFRDPRARPSCADLVLMGADAHGARRNGGAMAKLCLANRTPAILVPGIPPIGPTQYRTSEYERHGIEWVVTGDVYDEDFERFREAFNDAIFGAIDAERGQGYLERLSNEIDARVDTRYGKSD